MNLRKIFYISGWIQLALVLSVLIAIPVAVYYKENTIKELLLSSIIIAFFSFCTILQGFFLKDKSDLKNKEGMVVAGLTWVLLCIFSSLPYLLTKTVPNFNSAIFEAVSSLTTTGASNILDLEAVPKSIIFWRSLTQWMGGMGFIVLVVAILPLFGMGGSLLFKNEVPGLSYDKLKPRITETAKFLWKIYLSITVVFCSLLLIGGMDFFDAICHTFSMMATGGFSTKNNALMAYNNAYIEFIIATFLFICSINFTLYYLAIKGNFKALYTNTEVKVFCWIIVIASVLIFMSLIVNQTYENFYTTGRHTLFQVISVLSTTGSPGTDWNSWPAFSQTILFLLYFIGGTSCSTSSSLKVIRWVIMFKSAYRALMQAIHPKAVLQTKLGNKIIPNETIYNVWAIFFIFIFLLITSTLLLLTMGLDFLTSFSTTVACLTNVGTPITFTDSTPIFYDLPWAAKYILSFCMLLGRLEYLTLFILFIPSFWKN